MKHRRVVFGLLVAALAVRASYLHDLHGSPLFEGLVLDEANYDEWALRIAGGDVLGEGTFTANPLGPYMLGLLYAVVGRDLLAVRAVQMVVGAGSCFLIYRLALNLFGPRPALVTLALAAFYGPMIFTSANLVAESWTVLFIAASLALLSRPRAALIGHFLSGALLALAALGRPNLLLLVPVLPLALAERYSEELSRNVVRGMRSGAEKGFWQYGHAPFGYAIDRSQGGQRLVVTDDVRPQFEVVQRVFRETLDGVGGARRIADRLTREGIQPPGRADMPRQYAEGTWRAKHVASMLTNPLYCGHLVYDGEIAARNCHEAAIDEASFERVLAIRALKARNRDEGEGNGENPITASQRGVLTPFLRCGCCGGPICVTAGGQPKKRTYLYTCRTRQESSAACSGVTIRVEKLDGMVLDAIESHVLAPEALDVILGNGLNGLAGTQVDELAGERERLANVIVELDRKIRLTAVHAINGMIDESDAKAITAPLIAQRETARLQLAALPQQTDTPEAEVIDADEFRAAVREAWTSQPLHERRHALSRVLEKVELSPGGLEIICRADGYHGHDPFGPPNAPMSFLVPSSSS